jgi:hypothetical protein
MTIRTIIFLLTFWISIPAAAQETTERTKKKGLFYFEGGSHRAFYSTSDIRVRRGGDPSFDFTLYGVKAKDEGGLRFHTAPQFSYAVGYYFTEKGFGLEYHYDHIKYFVQQGQRVRLRGNIEGHAYDQDTVLTADFFQMEHSDGGNYAMLNVVKWIPLTSGKNPDFTINLVARAGFGVLNPKTKTVIMGAHRDDRYHISGFVTGVETGLRFVFFRRFTAGTTVKGAYANYRDFLIAGGRGRHHFLSAKFIYQIGAQFPL